MQSCLSVLALSFVALSSVITTGCDAVVVDDPTPIAQDTQSARLSRTASLKVKWALKKGDGSWAACPASYDKVRVTAEAVGPDNDNTGVVFIAMADCKTGATTLVVPIEGEAKPREVNAKPRAVSPRYVVEVTQTDASGSNERGKAHAVTVDLGSGDATTAFTIDAD